VVALRIPMAQVEQVQPTVATVQATQVQVGEGLAKMALPPLPITAVTAVLAQHTQPSQVHSTSLVLAEAVVLGRVTALVVMVPVKVERAPQQRTPRLIAVVAAVAVAVEATPRTEVTAGQVLSSFALQVWITTIGRSQHGSTLPQKIMA